MLSYEIPNNLIIELRELDKSLYKLYQSIQEMDSEQLEYIKRSAFISNIGASTRIENAVLTDIQVDWLDTVITSDSKTTAFEEKREFILNKLSKDKERSVDEVAGCRAMMYLIQEQGQDLAPLTESTLRGLHKELLQYYVKAKYHSGSYKKISNSVVKIIANKQSPVLVTSMPGMETEEAMTELVNWYNSIYLTQPWSIAVAVEFVFRFLAIHPFQDGNGRLGRALFNLLLLQSSNDTISKTISYLPIDRHIEKRREEYYLVLRQCSKGKFLKNPKKYNYLPFLKFMLKVINASMEDFALYKNKHIALNDLSNSAYTILSCFKDMPEKRLQTKHFIEVTGLARPTINDALRTLKNRGFIQRYGKGPSTRYQLIF